MQHYSGNRWLDTKAIISFFRFPKFLEKTLSIGVLFVESYQAQIIKDERNLRDN